MILEDKLIQPTFKSYFQTHFHNAYDFIFCIASLFGTGQSSIDSWVSPV